MKINGMKTMNGVILKSEENKITFIFKDNEESLLMIENSGFKKAKVSFFTNNEITKSETVDKVELSDIGMKYVPNYLLNPYINLIKNF